MGQLAEEFAVFFMRESAGKNGLQKHDVSTAKKYGLGTKYAGADFNQNNYFDSQVQVRC